MMGFSTNLERYRKRCWDVGGLAAAYYNERGLIKGPVGGSKHQKQAAAGYPREARRSASAFCSRGTHSKRRERNPPQSSRARQ
jgi:hypothetical protein